MPYTTYGFGRDASVSNGSSAVRINYGRAEVNTNNDQEGGIRFVEHGVEFWFTATDTSAVNQGISELLTGRENDVNGSLFAHTANSLEVEFNNNPDHPALLEPPGDVYELAPVDPSLRFVGTEAEPLVLRFGSGRGIWEITLHREDGTTLVYQIGNDQRYAEGDSGGVENQLIRWAERPNQSELIDDAIGVFTHITFECLTPPLVLERFPFFQLDQLGADIVFADQEFDEDTSFSFTVPGGGAALTAKLANGSPLPTWLSFDGNTFSGTPPLNYNGSLDILLTEFNLIGPPVTETFRLVIKPVNDDPTGDVVVDGAVMLGHTLTADTTSLDDPDGLGTLSFQWQTSTDGVQWTDVAGATSQTFLLTDAEVGLLLRVVVSYTDDGGTPESVTSEATTAAGDIDTVDLSDIVTDSSGLVFEGQNAGDRLGWSVSDAGDVNGDGFDDIIVGAWGGDPNGSSSGKSYVVFGTADGTVADLSDVENGVGGGFVINGSNANDLLGWSVSGAGDVNGDGLDDVIVGAGGASKSYVVFGKREGDTGYGQAVNLSAIENGRGGFVILPAKRSEGGGSAVSNAGDVNGDGYDDLIVGAETGAGRAYVVFGKADGTEVELSGIKSGTSDSGFIINGAGGRDYAGWSVSGAGDVNGDGLDDLIVGAVGADPNGSSSGASYVVFGKREGDPGYGEAMDLSDIEDGIGGGFVINGVRANDWSGYSVSSAGDVNGDGLDDLIVGAGHADPDGKNAAGASYVVFGKTDMAAVELSDIANGTGGFVINGAGRYDYSGMSVSSAGDVNGDGLDDLIIGAKAADPNGSSSGASYLVFGKADETAVELSDIESGIGGFVINGVNRTDYSGNSVSGAGDVNGDGFDDLLIGAPYVDPNGSSSGTSYVVYGGDFTGAATQIGGFGDDTLTATDGTDVLFGGAGDDTFEGLGDGDRAYGGQGADVFQFAADASGTVTLEDFEDGVDQIDVSMFGVTSFSDLTIAPSGYGGRDTEITVDAVADFTILLKDFAWPDPAVDAINDFILL